MTDIPVQSHLNAHGRRFGEKFYAPDTDKTWRLIGVGIWRMIEDPAWWPDLEPVAPEVPRATSEALATAVDTVTPTPEPVPAKPSKKRAPKAT